jgi:hypothetical protein
MTIRPQLTTGGHHPASSATPRAEPAAMAANAKTAARPTVVQLPSAPITAPGGSEPQLQYASISHYFDLEIEARQCADLDVLRFAIVNSTRNIAGFEQAFLAEPSIAGGLCVTRASSVSKIDRSTPLVRAVDAWLQHPAHAEKIQAGELRLANLEHEAREWGLRVKSFEIPYAMWLPLKSRDGRLQAALVALKSENWRPQHTALMIPLAGAYGHAWDALAPKAATSVESVKGYVSKRRLAAAVWLACLFAAFIPVPMSSLAPSEIIAAEPILVTAPIEGVIGDILAAPGAWVEKGAPIVKYVDVKLRNDAEVAARTRAVAEARHFKVVQSALATQKEMQDLALAKAELDVANAEWEYAVALLDRSTIRAERTGLLIYSSKSDWIGKPVSVGERLMEIGDPAKSEIKIELPVSDAIALKAGGTVSLFLDGDPLRSIDATIARTSFRPMLTAEQQLAFRVHAKFADGQPRRIGLRGVARVNGEPVSLWFYLFRRPIAAVRQKVGL